MPLKSAILGKQEEVKMGKKQEGEKANTRATVRWPFLSAHSDTSHILQGYSHAEKKGKNLLLTPESH